MTYTIHKSDGTVLTTIEEGTVNTGACSIALVGRRTAGYGVPIAESLVRLLENNASNSAPLNPLVGQLWFDKGSLALKLYNGSTWAIVASFSSNGATLTGYQLVLTCPDGVVPIVTNSKSKVTNLNADYLDGYDSAITATPLTAVIRNSSGDVVGVKFQGQATSTVYADVAERFEASEDLEIGDIVGLGGEGEIQKSTWSDGYCLGVISGKPGVRMNEDAGSDDTHPFVGYLGRIPVKVLGKVKKGDVLGMSEIPGTARAAPIEGGVYGFMVGRALEDKEIDDVGLVLAVIGTR